MISVSRCARLSCVPMVASDQRSSGRFALPFPNLLLISWRIKLRHMLQEVLIVGENHVVKRMVVTQEYAGVVVDLLEGDAVAE